MDLQDLRKKIDEIDDSLISLLERRMDLSADVARVKRRLGVPVYDPVREHEILDKLSSKVQKERQVAVIALYSLLFELSRAEQEKVLGNTARSFGLLGEFLSHSYSPMIHAELGDYEYRLYEKKPDELDMFFKFADFDGLNVTIPYKKEVIKYCGSLSETASAIGSVNTITRLTDGSLFGDTTDCFGFEYLLRKTGINPADGKILILDNVARIYYYRRCVKCNSFKQDKGP